VNADTELGEFEDYYKQGTKNGFPTDYFEFPDVEYMFYSLSDNYTRYFSPRYAEQIINMLLYSEENVGIGVDIKEVNLGSMAHSQGKVVVTNAVAMDQADVDCIEKIASMGVKFDVRKVPADKPEPFDAVMAKAKSELAAQGK
jgi:mannose/fructose/N-acetylgalactosamine-specific phosphotransferase system component IIB